MKLLVSDYDRTLKINYDFKPDIIIQFNLTAIKRFMDEGNLFMLNTGRDYNSIEEEIFINQIPYNYLACNDGTLLMNGNNDIIKMFDLETINYNYEYIISLLKKYDMHPLIIDNKIVIDKDSFNKYPFVADMYYLNYNIVDDKVVLDILSLDEAVKRFKEHNRDFDLHEWKYNNKLLEYGFVRNNPKVIFSLYRSPKIIDSIETLSKIYNIDYAIFMERIIFLRHKDITKSSMIEVVKENENLHHDDIYTIGDNYNDYQMIKDYHGYTLPWGKKELKEVSEGVVPSVRKLIKKLEG